MGKPELTGIRSKLKTKLAYILGWLGRNKRTFERAKISLDQEKRSHRRNTIIFSALLSSALRLYCQLML